MDNWHKDDMAVQWLAHTQGRKNKDYVLNINKNKNNFLRQQISKDEAGSPGPAVPK